MDLSVSKSLLTSQMNAEVSAQNRTLAKAKEKSVEERKIGKLAEEFESIFVNMMFKTMRKTVQKSGMVDGGHAEEIFNSMLDSEYAKSLAGQRSLGLADQIEKDLLKALGSQQASNMRAEGLNHYQAKALRGSENKEKMLKGTRHSERSEASSPATKY